MLLILNSIKLEVGDILQIKTLFQLACGLTGKKWLLESMGILTNYHDAHKYISDAVMFCGNFLYRHNLQDGITMAMELGPHGWMNTGDIEVRCYHSMSTLLEKLIQYDSSLDSVGAEVGNR